MKILVADDHPLYREAVRAQIERWFERAVVQEVESLDDVFARVSAPGSSFVLLLVDFHMPGMSLPALARLVETFPKVPVAVISGTANTTEIKGIIEAGARGFIPKVATGKHLAHTLEILLAGGTSVPADALVSGTDEDRNGTPAETAAGTVPWLSAMTMRELQVLKAVARGLSNKEIGRELDLAEVTVKLHLRGVFRKIGARSRADAAVIATKAGI